MDFSLPPEIVTLIGTLGGMIFGALGGISGALINNKATQKRALIELSGKIAIENWKFRTELAKQYGIPIKPPEIAVLQAMKMCKLALETRRYDDVRIRAKLDEISEMIDVFSAHSAERAKRAANDQTDDRDG